MVLLPAAVYEWSALRSGGGRALASRGGQQPLAMRLPKLPGFTNHNRVEYAPVNVARLNALF